MAHKKRLPKAYLDLPIQGKLGAWDVRNELVTAGDVSSVMTVDPGLSGTGVAVFPLLSLREGVESLPEFTECITDSSIQTWDTRGEHILSRFAFLLNVYNPEHLVIEGVKYFVGSARSQAATTKGDLFKLAARHCESAGQGERSVAESDLCGREVEFEGELDSGQSA